ncbi:MULTISPECIES: S1 domain-containing post-transcriptional regulator GSP13 [Bacillales]|uniref:S1 domain-containing post-transcriptional regulator GSP13 n=1 Tax=Lysinibacillus louembei TaxID=1470088 RepID=A0ABZ0RTU3_9BACI|nr:MULTISPECIES: S1 domain-containing post-transcriptional regulator GSP13 [Bacillales]MCT6925019.1 S1 domain-containing post-transcriptional regulator GSP13 [Metasolibacillus sp.]MCT6942024.1 S1 domain-containing post-transcriptional regulator GSP13 [Metasolibacillus sp.]WPK10476.1 S1 domain-containing post-transcriptional regulator GSP13 [Lysinibacillus louembei]
MEKQYKVGDVLTGKVTGIQPYGAFVALDEQTQGLVHISEITYGFVKDVSHFLKVGDEITVKILEIEDGSQKISLSIRALQEEPTPMKKEQRKTLQERIDEDDAAGFQPLKDKLQEWIDQSGQK